MLLKRTVVVVNMMQLKIRLGIACMLVCTITQARNGLPSPLIIRLPHYMPV